MGRSQEHIDWERVAHKAYDAYGDRMNWKLPFSNREMLLWKHLSRQQKEAWEAAALAAYTTARSDLIVAGKLNE